MASISPARPAVLPDEMDTIGLGPAMGPDHVHLVAPTEHSLPRAAHIL